MKKILLICAAGMSTSIVEKAINDLLKNKKLDIVAKAMGLSEAKSKIKDYDVILLGPQIAYRKDEINDLAGKIPVYIMKPIDYALSNAKEILKTAQML